MKIAVIGSGGREHAICWALAKSPLVSQIICIPGNGGTAHEDKCININPVDCEYAEGLQGIDAVVQTAVFEKADIAVIGPEDPLVAGISDQLWSCGIPVVGPKAKGAALEGSKDLSKIFMKKHGVACAKSETFTNAEEAHTYIDKVGAPIVIKADRQLNPWIIQRS